MQLNPFQMGVAELPRKAPPRRPLTQKCINVATTGALPYLQPYRLLRRTGFHPVDLAIVVLIVQVGSGHRFSLAVDVI